MRYLFFFFFKQKTAYEMRISDWSSDVCSSDLEIIVTAQKREQSLNSVGLTVTAISGEALAERNLTSLQEIASASPGLNFTTSPSNTPILTIRGVGFDSRNLGATPSVSVYLDQQPLPFPILEIGRAHV